MDRYCAFCDAANETSIKRRHVKVEWMKEAFAMRLPDGLADRPWRVVPVCESCWKEVRRD